MDTSCILLGMTTTKEKQRAAFQSRLIEAATEAGQHHRGLYADISRDFTSQGHPVSEQGVKRWFDGGAVPREDACRRLAARFKVPYKWLRYGEGPVEFVDEMGGQGQKQTPMFKVPLLTPSTYEQWKERSVVVEIRESVRVQGFLSENAFAFTINDNSAQPLVGKGMKVVVNPDDEGLSDPVNAKKPIVILDQGTFMIGRFSLTPYPTLEPLNADFGAIKLSANYRIVGVLAKIAEFTFE